MPGMFVRAAQHEIRYPDQEAWLVLVGTLDIVFTSIILWVLGGTELNPIARAAAESMGAWGLIALKYSTLTVVILVSEYIGITRPSAGKRLLAFAIGVSIIPVVVGASLTASAI